MDGGRDVVTDLQSNVDFLVLSEFGFANSSPALACASNQAGSVVFDFGGGNTLTVLDTSINQISNDIIV